MNTPVKIRQIVLLCLIPVMISGCFDTVDIDQRMIVCPIGIDAAPDQQMAVTFRIPLVRPEGKEYSGGGKNANSFIVRYSVANGILPALIQTQDRDEHSVFLGHCRAIVFGEDYAKQGISLALDFFNRLPVFPPNSFVVIGRPEASAIIKIQWPEQELHDQNIRLFFTNIENSKFGIKKWELYQRIVDPLQDPLIPLVTPSDDAGTMKLLGMAVFYRDRMVGELNREEATFYGLVKCPGKKSRLTVPTVGPVQYGFEVVSGKKIIRTACRNNHPVFDCRFHFKLHLIEAGSYKAPLKDYQVHKIEAECAEYLQTGISALFHKLRSMKSDPLGFGNYYRIQQAKHYQPQRWLQDYQQAEFRVKVKVFIERLGILK